MRENFGGIISRRLAIATSYVGLVHPSVGLCGFRTPHCKANCIVMNMEQFYPKQVVEFKDG